jgi:hypothetical protein
MQEGEQQVNELRAACLPTPSHFLLEVSSTNVCDDTVASSFIQFLCCLSLWLSAHNSSNGRLPMRSQTHLHITTISSVCRPYTSLHQGIKWCENIHISKVCIPKMKCASNFNDEFLCLLLRKKNKQFYEHW